MLALVLFAALQGYAPTPEPAATVGGWLSVCASDQKACADQLYDRTHDHSVGDQKLDFCVPDAGDPKVTAQTVAAWLKTRPELAQADA